MKKLSIGLLFFLTIAPQIGLAKALIFVQGYEEDGSQWRTHGVTTPLVANGWSDGGHLVDRGFSIGMIPATGDGDHFYTVALPTEAPLRFQQRVFARYVDLVRSRHQGESIIFVGHSAGGVLARLYMVQHPGIAVAGLVTIASPHRGTGISEVGLMVGQSPLSWGLPFIGADSINRSQELFYNLERETPGSFLFWLNRQRHPDSRYLSIIRDDWIVAPESQDMRFVAALVNGARVKTVFSQGDHALNPYDGHILVNFLNSIQ